MKYTAAVALLMLQTASATECKLGIKYTKHESDDCSGEGEVYELDQEKIESYIKCYAVDEGSANKVCDETGIHSVTYSDKECKTETSRKPYVEWGKCESKRLFTNAQYVKAAVGSLVLGFAAYMN